jgi:hypothetical protein
MISDPTFGQSHFQGDGIQGDVQPLFIENLAGPFHNIVPGDLAF